ncbi:23S rRNA pseudouridine2605 synthase [Breznakibacter xylanolyticus]|uniref:Pseudouridine synthase n=1 Tax=Breznakibacter xylanolyticus TaxID=990 RepID=A0A2W7N7T5_9BACT|nr:pseudouridine synthase [Breznakibacter xylanolyticus]PZX14257.1 23S rRNA pseudouridine2605 synthase [Breznakibacter xylanolyticus]
MSERRERSSSGVRRDARPGNRPEAKTPFKPKKVISTANLTKPDYSKAEKMQQKEGIRLNRYIANAGICSRRDADKLIADGQVTVNGKVVTEMGTLVGSKDKVVYNGKQLSIEPLVYILLNKPKNVVTSLDDPHAKMTVMDIVKHTGKERIYPVGRLDKNTTGLLLFTNDGDLAKKLTHPKYNVKKIYHAFLDKPVTISHLQQIGDGLELEDGPIKADSVSYVDGDKQQVGIEIHSGRNRIVRRIFEHFGYNVDKLDRVYFAGLTKKNLQRGHWRYLTEKEVMFLKAGMVK